MKKITIILALAFSAVFYKAQQMNALPANANITNWQDAILRADGLTEVDGVEAYSMKTTCGTEEVVFIKFVNKNNYKVRVEWVDAIKTAGGWIYAKTKSPKSLYIEPGNTIIGQCNGLDKLKVNISSILDNPQDFGHFAVSGLVTKLTQTQNTK